MLPFFIHSTILDRYSMQVTSDILEHGVFPLPICVLPGEIVPLHVFEPRYRKLIADRLADHQPYVMANGTDEEYANVSCAVHVVNVIKKFDDGRLNVVVRGHRRVTVAQRLDSAEPYLVAKTTWLYDDPDETVSDELVDNARETFRRVAHVMDWGPNLAVDVERDPAKLSWNIGMSMGLSREAKQELLETTSIEDRLNTEIRWLTSLLLRDTG